MMTDEGAERLATENDGHHKLQKDEQSAQKSLKPYKLLKQRRIVYPTMRERVLRGRRAFFVSARKKDQLHTRSVVFNAYTKPQSTKADQEA
jgi:hypothetical protein